MDPATHGLTGWLIATGLRADARTRGLAVGLPLAAAFSLWGTRWRRSAVVLYLAFLSHLAWDLTFVDWPEKLLWPLSQYTFHTLGWGPWSAPHLLSLGAVCACTVVVMLRTGFTPWELVYPRRRGDRES